MLFIESKNLDSNILTELEDLIAVILPKRKDCYRNARKLAIQSAGKFQYFEGAAFSDSGNFCHAWNVYQGVIVDISPDTNGEAYTLGKLKPKWRYNGFPFELEQVVEKDNEVGEEEGKTFSPANKDSRFSMLTNNTRLDAMKTVLPEHAQFKNRKKNIT